MAEVHDEFQWPPKKDNELPLLGEVDLADAPQIPVNKDAPRVEDQQAELRRDKVGIAWAGLLCDLATVRARIEKVYPIRQNS